MPTRFWINTSATFVVDQGSIDGVARWFKLILVLSKLFICSWNARTLFSSRSVDFSVNHRKWRMVENLMERFDILIVQETHGYDESLDCFSNDLFDDG